MALTTPQALAQKLAPWRDVLRLCGAQCRTHRAVASSETVALVTLDVARLLLHCPGGTLGRTRPTLSDAHCGLALTLREAMELVRLAVAVDARVLEALEEARTFFPWMELGHCLDLVGCVGWVDVAFEMRYNSLTLTTLRELVETQLMPREDLVGGPEFQRVRESFRAELRRRDDATQRLERPLRVAIVLIPGDLFTSAPPKRIQTVRNFFAELSAAAVHVQAVQVERTQATSTRALTSTALAHVEISSFQVNMIWLIPKNKLLAGVEGLSATPGSLVQCERLALSVCDIDCSQDELTQYLTIVLRDSPDAIVRIMQNSVLKPVGRVKRRDSWATETWTLFHALAANESRFRSITVEATSSSGSFSQADRVLFWTAFLETVLAVSHSCSSPLKVITLEASRHVASGGEAAVLREANASFQGAKRSVESLVVNSVSTAVLDDVLEFMQLVGPVQHLRIDTSYQQPLTADGIARMLDLHPTLKTLRVGSLSLDSLDFVLQRFGTAGHLEALVLCDAALLDTSSVVRFFSHLSDPNLPLVRRLHTLHFNVKLRPGPVLDDAMVAALDRMLSKNRFLCDVSVIVHRDTSSASREALLAHNHDIVVPPGEVRHRDIAERLAFLSVVKITADGDRPSAMAELDALQLRLIFGFSGTRWIRCVRIHDESRVTQTF